MRNTAGVSEEKSTSADTAHADEQNSLAAALFFNVDRHLGDYR
jgi:hypothetical protein